MDSIKATISSVTGTGLAQADGDSNKPLQPTPPETGLQSRDQTVNSGSGSFLGGMKDMVNATTGAGGTKEEKEIATDKGQVPEHDKNDVQQAGDEQIAEFIRDKYHSQADEGRLNKGN